MAKRFNHIDIRPEIWTRSVPPTSMSCHLFPNAIHLVEKHGELSALAEEQFGGKSVVEEAAWRCRLGFFRDLQDIADRNYLEAMASDMALPLASIHRQIDSAPPMGRCARTSMPRTGSLSKAAHLRAQRRAAEALWQCRLPDHRGQHS